MAAATAVAAVGMATPLAQAGVEEATVDGYTYLYDSSELLTPPTNGGLSVFCPSGTSLLGVFGGINSGNVGHTNAIFPLDGGDGDVRPDDGLALDAHNASGAAKSAVVQPVCKRGSRRFASRTRTLADSQTRSFSVKCPGRTHVTSGGGFVGGPIEEGRLLSTTPFDGNDVDARPDDGWRIGATATPSTGERSVTVHAICQRRSPRYEVGGSFNLAPGTEFGTGGSCANDAHLIGAGVDLELNPDAQVSAILSEDSPTDGDLARDDSVNYVLTHRNASGTQALYVLIEICSRS